MKTHKGIFYFTDYGSARSWANQNGWSTERIICYRLGWAIQSAKSSFYAGPGVQL